MKIQNINSQQNFKSNVEVNLSDLEKALSTIRRVVNDYRCGKGEPLGLCSEFIKGTKGGAQSRLGLVVGDSSNQKIIYGLDFNGKSFSQIKDEISWFYLRIRNKS